MIMRNIKDRSGGSHSCKEFRTKSTIASKNCESHLQKIGEREQQKKTNEVIKGATEQENECEKYGTKAMSSMLKFDLLPRVLGVSYEFIAAIAINLSVLMAVIGNMAQAISHTTLLHFRSTLFLVH